MEEFEHTMPIEQLLEKLEVETLKSGISDHQLFERLSKDGYNIPPKTSSLSIIRLTLQENVHFLLYTIVLTLFLIELVDKGPSVSLSHMFIIAFTFVSHMIDLFMVEKPKFPKFGTLIAVIRNGQSNIVDSKYLVRGDVVELEQSMVSPADIRLVKANNMLVNGSCLIQKAGIRMASAVGSADILTSPNMVLQGFKVETGKGIGIVLATGKRTVLGSSSVQTIGIHRTELGFYFGLAVVVAVGCYLNRLKPFATYSSFLALCLSLSKFPHFIKKGRSTSLLSVSHLLISQQVYPKAVQAYESLLSMKCLVYDIRDVLITTKKEIKKIYINDSLQNVQNLKTQKSFNQLLRLANFALYKEPVVEEPRENVPLEEWDPRPKEKEYEHPVSLTLREFLSQFNLPKPDLEEHLKIPLTTKNRNSLTVVTSESESLAILIGEAADVMPNCKKMRIDGKDIEIPRRSLLSLCEDLSLEGNLCIALAFSEIDKQVLVAGEELKPDVFEFSLLGIFVIKEYTEDNHEALLLADQLGITTFGVGRSSKDYLLNLAYSSKLLDEPPEMMTQGVDKSKNIENKGKNVLATPAELVKDLGRFRNRHVFVPGIGIFDTTSLLNQLKSEQVGYLGNNHLALQVANMGASLECSIKEAKDSSQFVLLSTTPLVDLLKAIKTLKETGTHDFFLMLENIGCFIPSLAYFLVCSTFGLSSSSLCILLTDFAVPLSNQFLWIGLPRSGYTNPLLFWILTTCCSFYNYFSLSAEGVPEKYCNFGFFLTLFMCSLMKVAWLHIWNWNKCKNSWTFAYVLLGVKVLCFWFYGFIRFVANRNLLETGHIRELVPGLLIFWPSMLGLSLLSRK